MYTLAETNKAPWNGRLEYLFKVHIEILEGCTQNAGLSRSGLQPALPPCNSKCVASLKETCGLCFEFSSRWASASWGIRFPSWRNSCIPCAKRPEQWKKGPWLFRVFRGLYYGVICALYIVIFHIQDPYYLTTSIMESKRVIFVAHLMYSKQFLEPPIQGSHSLGWLDFLFACALQSVVIVVWPPTYLYWYLVCCASRPII